MKRRILHHLFIVNRVGLNVASKDQDALAVLNHIAKVPACIKSE